MSPFKLEIEFFTDAELDGGIVAVTHYRNEQFVGNGSTPNEALADLFSDLTIHFATED